MKLDEVCNIQCRGFCIFLLLVSRGLPFVGVVISVRDGDLVPKETFQ